MADSTDRPKAKSLRPLWALLPYLAPHRWLLLSGLLALLVSAAALLALPLQARQVIDHTLQGGTAQLINRYFYSLLILGALLGIFGALRGYLITRLGDRLAADLRETVYRRIVRMDPTFFEVTRTGEVLSRLTADTTLVQAIGGANLAMTLSSGLNMVGGLVMLELTSARLTAVLVVLIPLVIAPLVTGGRRVRRLSRETQDRIADMSSLVDETLNAIQTLQSFTLEELKSQRYTETVERSFAAANRRTRARSMMSALGNTLVFAGITYVLWLGTRAVRAETMTSGQLGQFLIYSLIIAEAAATLIEMWGEMQRAAGAMERLSELLSAKPSIVAPEQPVHLVARTCARISFENVSFRYPSRPESYALSEYSLEVRPGETVAIVGPSGAGKSTTLQLLLRFYDPEYGRICIDGHDLRSLDPLELRQQMGLVAQETILFGASARENISYGRPSASVAEIEAAARAAGADEFIRDLPAGYDTFLGERGARLSGGQRQRIAIARAILKDPPILLLDEATSSLDAESERLVQAALGRLMRGRTTLIIAHRLATVLRADRTAVLQSGRLIAIGPHADLLRTSPLYARLAALQFASLEVPAAASS